MARKAFMKLKAGLMDALAYAKNHKYTYVVVVRVTGEVDNIHAGPVLGVHSNYTKAAKHFDVVLDDRKTRDDFKLYWQIQEASYMSGYIEMRKAYMEYRSSSTRMVKEEVIIQRWIL